MRLIGKKQLIILPKKKQKTNIQQLINPPEKEGQKESLEWDNIKNNKERKEEIKKEKI